MIAFLASVLIIKAYVTEFGPTGNKMANNQYPYVGSVACPRNYPLGAKVKIFDTVYTCNDRTSRKYDGRFDIFSTSTKEQMLKFGKKWLEITIL